MALRKEDIEMRKQLAEVDQLDSEEKKLLDEIAKKEMVLINSREI